MQIKLDCTDLIRTNEYVEDLYVNICEQYLHDDDDEDDNDEDDK